MARELDRSGCPKTPAQNIVGRDGSVGPPLFISPQTSQSGSLRLAQVPTGSHVHNHNIYCQVRIVISSYNKLYLHGLLQMHCASFFINIMDIAIAFSVIGIPV